jgi:hypothetical protein
VSSELYGRALPACLQGWRDQAQSGASRSREALHPRAPTLHNARPRGPCEIMRALVRIGHRSGMPEEPKELIGAQRGSGTHSA